MISRSFYSCSSPLTADSVTWNVFYNGNAPREVGLIKSIYDTIYAAVNKPRCTECFEAAGAMPIIKQDNLVFVTESVFTDPNLDSYWTPHKELADGMRKANNGTTSDITWWGLYKGKRYVGLTDVGLTEKYDYLSVTIIHALLHSGGKEGKIFRTWNEAWWGINPHDLRYLGKKYDDVIESCQNNKSRAGKATGKGENEQ